MTQAHTRSHTATLPLLFSFVLISSIAFSGCQSGSRTGTYPAGGTTGGPPTTSGTVNSSDTRVSQADIDACNDYAAGHSSDRNHTMDTIKEAAIGGAGGAGLGAAGGAIAGNAGKGAAIGAGAGALAGTLYGINQNRQSDDSYQTAYRDCMQERGY